MGIELSDPEQARLRAATPPHTVRPWPLPTARSERIEAIQSRLDMCTDPQQVRAVEDAVGRELKAEGTPLWEPDDDGWSRVTFVWIGDAPHGVALQLNRFSDPIDVADTMLVRCQGSRIHALTLRVPAEWLGSYLFIPLPAPPSVVLHRGVDLAGVWSLAAAAQEDPLARECIPSKEGVVSSGRHERLSVARAPAAPVVRLWASAAVEVESLLPLPGAITGAELPLFVWSHEEVDDDAPVVLLTDGEVWREQFPIVPELQRMIARGDIEPMHLVFLDSGGPRQRQLDYPAPPEQSRRMLELMRRAAAERVGKGRWIVAGQSLGGLFAALCAARHPDLVAAAVAQSPSLWWPAAPPYARRHGWFEERASSSGAPTLLEAGCYDWVVADAVRDAASLLSAQGALIGYDERPAGHDILQWQTTLPALIRRTLNRTRAERR